MMSHQEKRIHQRTRTLYKGQVVTEGRFSLIDCTVRDLSDGGARIEFDAAYTPPPQFELQIPSRQFRRQARTVWSSGLRHGVMFFDSEAQSELAPVSEDDALRIQRILQDAQRKIAETLRVEPELVRLKLDLPDCKD
ncbi:MAG: PilZ domain-containing protein [Beijerinckiaceae bacterium]